jgi:hypothetical protein
MASNSTPSHASFTLSTARPVDQSIADAKSFLTRNYKAKVLEQTADALKVRLGSAATFRMWGLGLTPKKQYPIRLSLTGRQSSSLLLDLASDEGWYAVKLAAVDDRFMSLFKNLAAELQTELSR